jgi:hypothetical protein
MPVASKGTDSTKWEELTEEVRRDRRREKRVTLAYPIEIYGFDRHGHYFTERAVTQNVSPSGCRFELKQEPEAQGVLAIRVVRREGARTAVHKPVLFLICWVQRSGRRWLIGASKLQSDDMWGLFAPPESTAS